MNLHPKSPQTLSAKITFEGPQVLKTGPGIPIPALIEIWPKDLLGNVEKRDWEGGFIGDLFYVAAVGPMGPSVNNEEVMQIRADIVFLKGIEGSASHFFEFKGKKIPFFLSKIDLSMGVPQLMDGNYFIMEEAGQGNPSGEIFGMPAFFIPPLALFGLALVMFAANLGKIKKWIRVKKERKEMEEELALIGQAMGSARTKKDIERIYEKRQDWERFLEKGNPCMIKFLSLVESNQYKRNWSEEDFRETLETSRKLKGMMAVR